MYQGGGAKDDDDAEREGKHKEEERERGWDKRQWSHRNKEQVH